MLSSLLGCFEGGSVPGKMQLGPAWWFLDQKNGMERQLEALSQIGSLRRFVGMVADSRSFLSFTRHEYFRSPARGSRQPADPPVLPAQIRALKSLGAGFLPVPSSSPIGVSVV